MLNIDPGWRWDDSRFKPGVAFAVLLLHGLSALAWSPSIARTPEETVLKAVILPPVKAMYEERPEPPLPERRPRVTPSVSKPVREAAASDWSEVPAETVTEALPTAKPTAFASASAAKAVRAMGEANAQLAAPAAVAIGRAGDKSVALSADASPSSRPVSAPASASRPGLAVPTAMPAVVAPHLPVRTALASNPADRPSAQSGPAQFSSGGLTVTESSTATQASVPLAPSRADLATAGRPVTASPRDADSGTPSQSGQPVELAGSAPPALARPVPLARTATNAGAQVASATSAAQLAETAARAGPYSPEEVRIAHLSQARAGRPVPVTSGGDGSNEFADYADNNSALVYPRLAVRMRLEGTVVLEVEVLPDGRPGDIRLKTSSGSALLDQDAMAQMATWRFKPTLRNGQARAARVSIPIHYRLHRR